MKGRSHFKANREALGSFIIILAAIVLTANCPAQELVSSSSTSDSIPVHPSDSEPDLMKESLADFNKGQMDAALDKVNEALKLNSQNPHALLLRGLIYAQQKQWDKAEYDYEVVLVIDSNNISAKCSLAELNFMQKKYDDARAGFAMLENDQELGDFATYKVFLCDLFGAHEDVANKELHALDDVEGNPSYYFANVAWDLVHQKTEDAQDWLKSADRIYANAPEKLANYSSSLTSLGYLPIRDSSQQ